MWWWEISLVPATGVFGFPAATPSGNASCSASWLSCSAPEAPLRGHITSLLLEQWAPCLGDSPEFDRSQFKIQPDGTFRISIRAMASMAGLDHRGLNRALKSAGDENALPCAISLLAQGFCRGDVNRWSETGGIPEDAAPFILEHYGINAVSPSSTARAMLLAFTRVGINAYLKEKLGFAQRPQAGQLGEGDLIALAGRTVDLLERLGGVDAWAQHQLRDMALNYVARQAGGGLLVPQIEMLSLQEGFRDLAGATSAESSRLATRHGRVVKQLYRDENGRPPITHKQLVNGGR
jgi:hypothetical protein